MTTAFGGNDENTRERIFPAEFDTGNIKVQHRRVCSEINVS